MSSRKFHLHDGRHGVALTIRVTPRASHNKITEILPDGTVKIRLTTSQVDGEGNKDLILFLAEVLGVKSSQIEIIGGISGNDKLLSVLDIDSEDAYQRLLAYLE